MSQVEVSQWEADHQEFIIGWAAEWDIKPGFKVVTFTLKDKSKHRFEIKIN